MGTFDKSQKTGLFFRGTDLGLSGHVASLFTVALVLQ